MTLTLSPAVRIYVATGATDLRPSIDGLSAVVRERLALDPLSGHLFLFRNRRGDRLKVLAWDQSGFWVLYKRLERGTFAWPVEDASGSVAIRSADLALLFAGVDVTRLGHARRGGCTPNTIRETFHLAPRVRLRATRPCRSVTASRRVSDPAPPNWSPVRAPPTGGACASQFGTAVRPGGIRLRRRRTPPPHALGA